MRRIQIYLTPGVEGIREYIYFLIRQLQERGNETKKSYIDQIPGYPNYVFIPAGHYGLFEYRHSKGRNDYEYRMLV